MIWRTMGVAFQESALFNSMILEENVGVPLLELTKLADPVIEIMTYMKLPRWAWVKAPNCRRRSCREE